MSGFALRLWMAMSLAIAAFSAETVAVHPLVPEDTLTIGRLRDMFLGRITTWKNGTAVVIILVEDPATDARLHALLGRDRDHLLRGWKRLVFSGSGAMPLWAASPRDALEAVARHPGAIALLAEVPNGQGWRRIPVADAQESTPVPSTPGNPTPPVKTPARDSSTP